MLPDWLFPAVTLVFMIASPVLAWHGSSKFFQGTIEQWRVNSEERWKRVDERIADLDKTLKETGWPAMVVRLARAEQDIVDLRQWKHVRGEPYVNAMDAMRRDVDRLMRDIDALKHDRRNDR